MNIINAKVLSLCVLLRNHVKVAEGIGTKFRTCVDYALELHMGYI